MSASIWMPVVAAAAGFFALVVAGAVVGSFLLWRIGRRRWRAFQAHGLVVGTMALWEATSGRRRPPGAADLTAMGRWTPHRLRKELWRSVDHADAAVRAATELGAPTGDLGPLCRRLRAAAAAVDSVLRVEPTGPAPEVLVAQARDVMSAASDLQRAAVSSASDATGHHLDELTADARNEVDLLGAGLSAARAALPPRGRYR